MPCLWPAALRLSLIHICVTAQQELFVPKGDACELDRLTLRNDSGTEKELDVFSYCLLYTSSVYKRQT